MNTQQKGQFAQLKVEQVAAEKGYVVSKPTIDTRYDLIIDDGESLHKVQVKYAGSKTTNGSINVGLRRWAGDKRHVTRNYTTAEVDGILVYIPQIDRVCWLPPELFDNKPAIVLRLEPTKSGQKKGINFAKDYFW
jgi:hypothetical protein